MHSMCTERAEVNIKLKIILIRKLVMIIGCKKGVKSSVDKQKE